MLIRTHYILRRTYVSSRTLDFAGQTWWTALLGGSAVGLTYVCTWSTWSQGSCKGSSPCSRFKVTPLARASDCRNTARNTSACFSFTKLQNVRVGHAWLALAGYRIGSWPSYHRILFVSVDQMKILIDICEDFNLDSRFKLLI